MERGRSAAGVVNDWVDVFKEGGIPCLGQGVQDRIRGASITIRSIALRACRESPRSHSR